MALRLLQKNFITNRDVTRLCSAFIHTKPSNIMSEINGTGKSENDMPIEMENPFKKENPKCILCKYDIEPNYRNVRLLSQFMSSYTGKVYGRHITGLCKHKQSVLEREIKKAQLVGLLGNFAKNPNFLSDPDLYDPSKPFRFL